MTIKEALAGLFKKEDLPTLPNSFMFGVATADHQCEAIDQKYLDIRDWWENWIEEVEDEFFRCSQQGWPATRGLNQARRQSLLPDHRDTCQS